MGLTPPLLTWLQATRPAFLSITARTPSPAVVSGCSAAVALALPAQLLAIRLIARHHADSPRLRRPIVLTLASAHLFGLVLALSFVADRLSRTA